MHKDVRSTVFYIRHPVLITEPECLEFLEHPVVHRRVHSLRSRGNRILRLQGMPGIAKEEVRKTISKFPEHTCAGIYSL